MSDILDCGKASPPGKLIDIGTHCLHIITMGEGSPTVLFESGGGDSAEAWRLVQPEVAKFTTAYSYDRAGLGWSDRGPAPRTSELMMEELRRLLAASNAPAPYVLVAHSFGGIAARLFARRHPQDIVGMVLIDSIHEDHYDRVVPIIGRETHAIMAQRMRRKTEDMRVPEDVMESINQLRAAPEFPNIPLVVITAGRNDYGPLGDPWDKVQETWMKMQAELAQVVPGGKHIMDMKSGHRPHEENPQLVVDCIREVVEESRRRQSMS